MKTLIILIKYYYNKIKIKFGVLLVNVKKKLDLGNNNNKYNV